MALTSLYWTLEDDYGNVVMAEKPYDRVRSYRPIPKTELEKQ